MGAVYSLGLFHRDVLGTEHRHHLHCWRYHFLWREIPRARVGLPGIWKIHFAGHPSTKFRGFIGLCVPVRNQSQ